MDWSELERRQPGLAGLGRWRLLEPGVVLVGTIRGDGTPRISSPGSAEQGEVGPGRQAEFKLEAERSARPVFEGGRPGATHRAGGRVAPALGQPPQFAATAESPPRLFGGCGSYPASPGRRVARHATSAARRARWLLTCGNPADPSEASRSSRMRRAMTTAPSVLMCTSR